MTHPLSSGEEMAFYLESARPRAFFTMYQFYDKFRPALDRLNVPNVVLTGAGDALPRVLSAVMSLRDKKPRGDGAPIRWNDFIKRGIAPGSAPAANAAYPVRARTLNQTSASDSVSAILYSGGTSGRTKGILLTNGSFNALADMTAEASGCIAPGKRMLAVMPVFHGFGLGICVHTALAYGVTCLLVPRFTVKTYLKLLKTRRPNYIAGVPTLFEALLRLPNTGKLDLSCLDGIFSGGDSMPESLKARVDDFLSVRGSPARVREGYGLTECVTACCLTPDGGAERAPSRIALAPAGAFPAPADVKSAPAQFQSPRAGAGCIGVPLPGILMKITEPGTDRELDTDEVGEICVSGATVMSGYDGDEAETGSALRPHGDGRVWLHTGDLGARGADGMFYFRGRIKRLIISSGYSVYPYHVESVLGACELVKRCCVVGVADEYKMQKIRAYVVLAPGAPPEQEAVELIRNYCRKALAPYNRPREYVVRDELPVTALGKVAYRELEHEAAMQVVLSE
jgi:long-chain acyl-CoA synthetase